MVSAMCESGETSALLSFPFVGMKEELENQLAFRAWTSDPRATPSYPNLLYSLLVSRCEYRKGMLPKRSPHLANANSRASCHNYVYTCPTTGSCRPSQTRLRKHCDRAMSELPFSHLGAIAASRTGALALLRQFKFTNGTVELLSKRKRAHHCHLQDHSEDTSARKPALLTVLDIRKEYTQALARLQLASLLPELATSGKRHSCATSFVQRSARVQFGILVLILSSLFTLSKATMRRLWLQHNFWESTWLLFSNQSPANV